MGERWLDVKGYENFYKVSSSGKIKSKGRNVMNNYCNYPVQPRLLKPVIKGNRYYKIRLTNEYGKEKSTYLHRLIAEAFIPNPENKPCVNHKDCNPLNNNANNLEWVTQKENIHHSIKRGRLNRTSKIFLDTPRGKQQKQVIATSLETGEKIKFNSMTEAAKAVDVSISFISHCCRGLYEQGRGYRWEYANK